MHVVSRSSLPARDVMSDKGIRGWSLKTIIPLQVSHGQVVGFMWRVGLPNAKGGCPTSGSTGSSCFGVPGQGLILGQQSLYAGAKWISHSKPPGMYVNI